MIQDTEQWAIFKTKQIEVGHPLSTGVYVNLGIGSTIWWISNLGTVKKQRQFSHSQDERPFKDVKLYWKGRPGYPKMLGIPTGEYVHRLVALHFVPNPQGHKYVQHIDGDRTNNQAVNLEWTGNLTRSNLVSGKRKVRKDKGQLRGTRTLKK